MSELFVKPTEDGVIATYLLEDGDTLEVAVTRAGVVFDAYSGDGEELLGTHAATADEWFNQLDS